MKYAITLILGFLTGLALFAAGLAYNPFISRQGLSPLTVTDAPTMILAYTGVAAESILYSNDGESRINPQPEKVLQLWEASIRHTSASVVVLRNGRGHVSGLGIKLSSLSEATRLFMGKALVNSVWYVYLPGRGSLFIEQSENYWAYLREIVLPAYRSSANTWTGDWLGNMTAGPGALRTAKVTGGGGEFEGMEMLAVESLLVRAWRADDGPVAAEGQLLIELPFDATDESLADDASVDEEFLDEE
jgi:hypothetical protein